MDLEVRGASPTEQPLLAALLELYQYDFTEYTLADLDDQGRFGAPWLGSYWSDTARNPFIVLAGGKPAGFALLHHTQALDGRGEVTDIDEFFVMRKYRRQRVGEWLATTLFDQFPGRWPVREMSNNLAAQVFWRTIIGRYTAGLFEERMWDDERWRGPVQYFAGGAAVARGV